MDVGCDIGIQGVVMRGLVGGVGWGIIRGGDTINGGV